MTTRSAGRLIYLMGASGSGKDTLLRHVRAMLGGGEAILIAHRYITRVSSGDETSIELSKDEFLRRAALGCFALHWSSHGLEYGIGIEIDAWMAAGTTVIVNGSREYLEQAAKRYPAVMAVQIAVRPDMLQTRLAHRGRENSSAIALRLARANRPFVRPADVDFTEVDNSGRAEDAARVLLALARGERARQ